ncbi:FAD-dependent oxidoreductase [Cellulomonas endophytica]|uniref:FAD-dependent oxidoreductase n=1 Tax=Cellulomonas endophytica TaxID=2494735 RepID=UPI001F0B9246|nr:FAD-dependent oxidoreductase [Cellulomonas endophytica]
MSTPERVDVVVVGGGAMGLAAAWRIAARGRDVHLLERYAPGHAHGASHGATRNFNEAYDEDDYLALVRTARTLWDRLADETGTVLLDPVGLVNAGPRDRLEAIRAAGQRYGVASAWVAPEAAAERWPGLRLPGTLLHVPGSGRVRAADALAALATAVQAHGAHLSWGTSVRQLRVLADDEVLVVTDTGTLRARTAVVAAGAWTADLLGGLVTLPRLVVTQEQPAHFPLRDPSADPVAERAAWPSLNHWPDPAAGTDLPAPVYGMLTPGEGLKVGLHGTGPVVDPDRRPPVDPGRLAALQEHVRRWFPGLDADRPAPISCTYTSTPTEDFVLERVGPLVVAAGFSGHGFKFVPAVGETLASLVDGVPAPRRFSPGLARRPRG